MKIAVNNKPAKPMTPEQLACVERLYRKYHGFLVRFLERMRIERMDVNDIAQEAYVRFARAGNFDQIKNQRAFLFRTAVNLVNDFHRRQARHHAEDHIDIESVDLYSTLPSPERVLQGKQGVKVLRAALRELHPKCLAVVVMSKFKGWGYKQIATELGISTSMVEKYMAQAMKLIDRRLNEAGEPRLKLVKSEASGENYHD